MRVYVLGAGSSAEVGMTIGNQLKSTAENMLDIRFEYGNRVISGDGAIAGALLEHVGEYGEKYNRFLHACWALRDALPQAISIDNLVDAHAGAEEFVLSSKLAIVKAILEAESNSDLSIDRQSANRSLRFHGLEETWYNKLFQILTQNIRVGSLADRLQELTFVTFNYDRTLELFFVYSISNYYRLPLEESAELVRGMKILHCYGKVGDLPEISMQNGIEFGGSVSGVQLLELAGSIRTFAEDVRGASELVKSVVTAMNSAEQIIYLGYAFHPLNEKLLSIGAELNPDVSVFGTTYGEPVSGQSVICMSLAKRFGCRKGYIKLHDIKAGDLVDEYRRTLSF